MQGRLDEADARFSEALSLTVADESCPVLVNLELVRERQGDVDGWEGRPDDARERYRSALAIVEGCAGRLLCRQHRSRYRTPRASEMTPLPRLNAKLDGLDNAPPPPPARATARPAATAVGTPARGRRGRSRGTTG